MTWQVFWWAQNTQITITQGLRFWRCGAHISVPLACKASALTFGLPPRCGKVPRRCFAQSAILSFFLSSSAFDMKFQHAIVFFCRKPKTITEALEMQGIDPLTSRMRSERSTISVTSKILITIAQVSSSIGNYEIFFRRKSASVRKFQYAILFLQKANNNYARYQVMEMQGLFLRTSRKQSEWSTIRDTSTLC